MRTLKFGLEKPAFVWFLVSLIYVGVFWSTLRHAPATDAEQAVYEVLNKFSDSTFPPRIALVREVPDWGHLAYHAVFGRVFHAAAGDLNTLRATGLAVLLLALFVFVRLGALFTYRNRLNPLWVSFSTLLMAANPYSWDAAFHLGYLGLLLLALLAALYMFEKGLVGWAAIFISFGVLIDWRALLLAVALILTRLTGEQSRLIRAERMLAFLLPLVVALLPLLAWQGVVPEGQAREWWHQFRSAAPLFRFDGLSYSLVLLPLYPLLFAWSWGIRARSRALTTGAIAAVVFIPLYFVFPIRFDLWSEIHFGTQVPVGLVDEGALFAARQYKNLALFLPWLAGAFLLAQLVLMDVLDRSRSLRYFVLLYFVIQPFVLAVGDREFLIVLPFILLLSLSEALVGDEGKLA